MVERLIRAGAFDALGAIDAHRDVGALPHGTRVRVEVVQRPGTAKGMAFATLADEHGLVNPVIHPQVYTAIRSVLRHAPVVVAEGRVQHDHRVVHVVVASATTAGHRPPQNASAGHGMSAAICS